IRLSFRDGALAPDLRCAIAHRGISRFSEVQFQMGVRCFAPPGRRALNCFFAALAMTVASAPLPPARADPAIDGVDHPRGVAGAVGGEEGHQVADLAGMRRTAEGKTLLEFLVA